MFSKFQRYMEKTDWDEFSSRGDLYLEILYASVIILSAVVGLLLLFTLYGFC